MTVSDADRRRLDEARAADRFLKAALAEDGMPVSAGGPPRAPRDEELAGFGAVKSETDRRFLEAALDEDGMPVSAGRRVPGPRLIDDEPDKPDLDRLPRWARVAYGARCARRVLPLIKQSWPGAPDEDVRALTEAVRVAEEFAADPAARFDATAVRDAARRAVDATVECRHSGGAIDNPALFSAAAAMAAVACADAARLKAVCEINVAELVANADEDAIPVLIRDFNTVATAAWAGGWTDDTPVPPQVFGPL